MLDPSNPLATYVGRPKARVVSEDGKKVVAWAGTLPAASDGSKRQEAAVCSAFTRLKLKKSDFDATMTGAEFEHVMGGNAPPRYDYHTGYFYDSASGTEVATLICTDDSLLVAKRHR